MALMHMSALALRQTVGKAADALGFKAAVEGVSSLAGFLFDRFTDQSHRLTEALQSANDRTWRALEIALAGESFLSRLHAAEDRAFRAQVRSFLDVTPVELLCHRAGLASSPASGPLSEIVESGLPLVDQRARFTLLSLKIPPVHPPRGAFLYSNGGFVIAGHLIELATKEPWEESLKELLFRPLGMDRAGFGPPGSPGICDQPRGHTSAGEPVATCFTR